VKKGSEPALTMVRFKVRRAFSKFLLRLITFYIESMATSRIYTLSRKKPCAVLRRAQFKTCMAGSQAKRSE